MSTTEDVIITYYQSKTRVAQMENISRDGSAAMLHFFQISLSFKRSALEEFSQLLRYLVQDIGGEGFVFELSFLVAHHGFITSI